MSGFEEWWAQRYLQSGESIEDLARSAWQAGQFALNSELGIAANEAAKAERLESALQKVDDALPASTYQQDQSFLAKMRTIIKEAQG